MDETTPSQPHFLIANKVSARFKKIPGGERSLPKLLKIVREEFKKVQQHGYTTEDFKQEVSRFRGWRNEALLQTLKRSLDVENIMDSQILKVLAIAKVLDDRKIRY